MDLSKELQKGICVHKLKKIAQINFKFEPINLIVCGYIVKIR